MVFQQEIVFQAGPVTRERMPSFPCLSISISRARPGGLNHVRFIHEEKETQRREGGQDKCFEPFWLLWQKYHRLGRLSEMKVTQLCPTFCNPMDYTVHGILQARILELVAFPFSRGSSQPRNRTQVSRTADGFFTSWATREVLGGLGNKHLMLTVLEAGKSEIRVIAQFLGRTLLLVCIHPSSCMSSHGGERERKLSYKHTNPNLWELHSQDLI